LLQLRSQHGSVWNYNLRVCRLDIVFSIDVDQNVQDLAVFLQNPGTSLLCNTMPFRHADPGIYAHMCINQHLMRHAPGTQLVQIKHP
jgi:hypothetical protein